MLVRRFSDAAVTELHRLRPHILMDAGELGSRNVSVNWLEVPAGASEELRSHEEAEQVYVVVSGSGTMSATGDTQRLERRRPGPDPARDRPRRRQRRHRAAGAGLGPVARRLRGRALQPPPRRPGGQLRRLRGRRRDSAKRRDPPPRHRPRPGPGGLLPRHDAAHGAVARASRAGCGTRPTARSRRSSRASPRRSRRWFEFAHEGPRGAIVERVEVTEEEPEGLTGFRVR